MHYINTYNPTQNSIMKNKLVNIFRTLLLNISFDKLINQDKENFSHEKISHQNIFLQSPFSIIFSKTLHKTLSTSLVLLLFTISAFSQTLDTGVKMQYKINSDSYNIIDVGGNSAPTFFDINKDGNLDLIVGESFGGLSVYNGNGDVYFDAPYILQTGSGNSGLKSTPVFFDIDYDSDVDLIIGESGGRIKVFNNNGTTFDDGVEMQTIDGIAIDVVTNSVPVFQDVNGDEITDLVVGSYSGYLLVFTGNADHSYNTADTLEMVGGIDIKIPEHSSPTFTHIDDDGYLDLVVGSKNGKLRAYKGTADNSFSAPTMLEAGGSQIDIGDNSMPIFTDLENDGDVDLVVGDYDGYLTMFKSNVFANLVPEIKITGNGIEILDGDNTPDVSDNTNFGLVGVDDSYIEKTFTIANTGNESLILNDSGNGVVSVSGSSGFTISTQPLPGLILPNHTVTFVVRFSPSSKGVETAEISLTSNDTDETTYNFTLKVETVAAAQTITFNPLSNATYGDDDIELTASTTVGLNIEYSSSNTNVATIISGSLHIVGVGTCTINANQSGNENYSSAIEVSQQLTVVAKALTVTGITVYDKNYDATTASTFSGGVLNGVVNDDVVILESEEGEATFDDKNVGTEKTVTITGLTLSGADDGNYFISSPTVSFADITQKQLSITGIEVSDKVYDGTNVATLIGGNLNGVLLNDDVSVSFDEAIALFADESIGNDKVVTVTGVSLSGDDGDNYKIYQPTGLVADITGKTLILTGVTVNNKVYDGTTNASFTGGTLSGLLVGDVVVLDSEGSSASFSDKNVGVNKIITFSDLSLSGVDAGNYTVSLQVTTTASITKKELSITGVTATNKVYDATTEADILGGTLNGVIEGDNVSVNTGECNASFADKNIGVNKAITITYFALIGTDSGNYSVVSPSGLMANITQKSITITGNNIVSNKVYDGTTDAELTGGQISGVIAGDVVNINTDVAVIAFATKNVGVNIAVTVTGIVLSGTDAGNYQFTQPTNITANITAKPIYVVNVDAANKVYDGTKDAEISGGILSGVLPLDTVSLDTTSVTAMFVDKNVGTGIAVIISGYTIYGSGATNYNVNQPNDVVADITKKSIIIENLIAFDKVYDGTTDVVIKGDDFEGVIEGDEVSIDDENQEARFADKNSGMDIEIIITGLTLSGADMGNYSVNSFADLKADIIEKKITATAYNKNMAEGDTIPDLTFRYNGFIGEEDSLAFSVLPTASTIATSLSPIGDYSIDISGGVAINYSFIYVSGILTIVEAPLVPDTEVLSDMWLEVRDTITDFPTANGGTKIATTTNKLTYYIPDTYTVTWNFENAVFQEQDIIVYKIYEQSGVIQVLVYGDYDLQWYFGEEEIGKANSLEYTPKADGIYSLRMTSNTSTVTTRSFDIRGVSPVPDVPTLPSVIMQLSGEITEFPTADNGEVVAFTDDVLSFTTPGVYSIKWNYIDENECTYSQTQDVFVFDVEENAGVIRVDVEGDFSYKWYLNEMLITGANESSYSPNESGKYKVELFSDILSAMSSGIFINESMLSVEVNTVRALEVYPNPTKNSFVVKNSNQQMLDIKIFDSKNMLLSEVKSNNDEVFVDVSTCTNGVLIVFIKKEDGIVIVEKIIKK